VYEDSLLKCIEVAQDKQWFIDNAIMLCFAAFFGLIALFVMLHTPQEPPR
jgi:hypothetical protein